MLTVYAYQNCSTCRNALKWLASRGIAHEVKPIREQPPSAGELARVLDAVGGDVRRLFNTSGKDYRELKLGEKLKGMSTADALKLLRGNGNLVKRPFVVTATGGLVGFDAEAWAKVLDR
ncbi:MAG TPA: Spx/MgsR family RNA polymerase-binding regulatory protein [Planctomycetota bacterium]|nr:Spx/MgsR family RNA polymerase-binding regulatory protein [Planctomycetota bacterium]